MATAEARDTGSKQMRTALKLLRLGLAPIPCWTPAECGGKKCSTFRRPSWLAEGRPWSPPEKCDRPGKHPRVPWKKYQGEPPTEAEVRRWWGRQWPEANIAIVTGSRYGLVVVDADSPAALAWAESHLASTPLGSVTGVRDSTTGWRGRQLYMRHPGTPVSNKAKIRTAEGKLALDLRADGGYVMAPGSMHPTGVEYEAFGVWTPEAFAGLPPLDRTLVTDAVGGNGRMSIFDRAIRWAAAKGPAVQGSGGHDHTYKLACDLVIGFALSDGEAMAVLRGDWNSRCQPPWSDGELEELVRGARNSGKGRMGYLLDGDSKVVHIAPARGTASAPGTAAQAEPGKTAGDAAPAEPITKLLGAPMTDYGNAERVMELATDSDGSTRLRWCRARQEWLHWDGKRWKWDETGAAEWTAKTTVRRLREMAWQLPDGDPRRRDLAEFALKSEAATKLRAMVDLFKSEPGVSVSMDSLDADDWCLNVQNGIVDLRTGELHPHSKSRLLTKLAGAEYGSDLDCPRWMDFLSFIMGDQPALVNFLQRAIGYSLTGSAAQELFFCYGLGANGKSVFLEVIARILGDYAGEAAQGLLLERKNEAHATEVADLVGRRFVTSEEVSASSVLDEGKVKRLTSGRPIKARFMHKDLFEFRPTHKLWIAVNHRPRVRSQDHGIWRRIKTIPFKVTIPIEKRRPFEDVVGELLTERAEILRWMVQGCLDWQRDGLQTPPAVEAETEDYKDAMDVIGRFLADCVTVATGMMADVTFVQSADLYRAYTDWCGREGMRNPLTQTAFSLKLVERGMQKVTRGTVRWQGISLRSSRPDE